MLLIESVKDQTTQIYTLQLRQLYGLLVRIDYFLLMIDCWGDNGRSKETQEKEPPSRICG